MEVNGLNLPEKLQELLVKGKWKCPPNHEVLSDLIGKTTIMKFDFLDLEGMRQESDLKHLVRDEKYAKLYGLASSKLLGQSVDDPNTLDIDNLVTIAVNLDEEAICLDYRTSHNNPKVVVCIWNDPEGRNWQIIAPDFDTFASLLNL